MQLILKQNPEDFYVEEILDKEFLKPSDKNIFLYKIEKQNLSHKELEYILKQKFPKTVFHFSGMKDKNAHTIQYATTNEKIDDYNNNQIDIKFIQNVNKHLFVGAHKENFFKIKTNYFKDYKLISHIGVPNYFDEQRFGNNIFIEFVEALEKNDFENALKIYLTRPSLNSETNKLHKEIYDNWQDLNKISKETKSKIFEQNEFKKQIFQGILKKDFKNAINLLNKKDVNLMKKQYESFNWNLKLKNIISKYNYKTYNNLLFNVDKIKQTTIIQNNLERNAFFYPKYLTQEKDKENKDFATISFSLPKGCYATIVIKHLFSLNYL